MSLMIPAVAEAGVYPSTYDAARHVRQTMVCQKNDPTYFCQNFVKSPPYLIIFGAQLAKTIRLCKVIHYLPHLIYANALPCY